MELNEMSIIPSMSATHQTSAQRSTKTKTNYEFGPLCAPSNSQLLHMELSEQKNTYKLKWNCRNGNFFSHLIRYFPFGILEFLLQHFNWAHCELSANRKETQMDSIVIG